LAVDWLLGSLLHRLRSVDIVSRQNDGAANLLIADDVNGGVVECACMRGNCETGQKAGSYRFGDRIHLGRGRKQKSRLINGRAVGRRPHVSIVY